MGRLFRRKLTAIAMYGVCFLTACIGGEGASVDGTSARPDNLDARLFEVVVYYANETPSDVDIFASRLENLKNGAMKAEQLINLPRARLTLKNTLAAYEKDLEVFSGQVEKDSRELESKLCKYHSDESSLLLFIFTNQLARRGKFRVCFSSDAQATVEELDFSVNLPTEQQMDFRFSNMPLSSADVFKRALLKVRNTLAKRKIGSDHTSVSLFLKSHVSSDRLLVPKHIYQYDFGRSDSDIQELAKIAKILSLQGVRLVDFEQNNGSFGLLDAGQTKVENLAVTISELDNRLMNISSIEFGDLAINSSNPILDLKVGDLYIANNQIITDSLLAEIPISSLKYDGTLLAEYLGEENGATVANAGFTNLPSPIGIDVDHLSKILRESELPLRVIAVDSCDSKVFKNLRISMLKSLDTKNFASQSVEVLFSNDLGLDYETVSFRTFPVGSSFAKVLRDKLKK